MKDTVILGEDDPFVPVGAENAQLILNILESRLPRSANLYNMAVLNCTTLKFKIYTLLGDYSSNCWILFIGRREDYGTDISISAPINPVITDEIKSAFIISTSFDWNERYMFAAVDASIAPMILEISGLVKGNATVFNPFYFFYMERYDASKFNIESPEGFQIKNLNDDCGVDFFVTTWKYSMDGTREYVQDVVQNGYSSGIYDADSPLSGILLNRNGLMGLLYTKSFYRGKGLAQLCMKNLMKELAENGIVPASCCERKNFTSKAFHEKIGMKISHECAFVYYTGSAW